ncbi:extracellular solute-binding protein [Paenibacillus pasadenensis]|uniref:Multiple sugar ABC transporter, substrate-binding protein n=1 Tax=Paenibacillus pasadenensis TaxID=217090 RepID=A0A2N5N245_9BACL|nr:MULTISPECIES: extracellular solute-binding protein [Paenibacillus]PLT44410.1 Multiple sugar ABC transporter, substrate-binding protein [Paenibacillus pasadenensis]
MSKKTIGLLMTTALLATALAGCSGNGNGNGSGGSEANANAGAAANSGSGEAKAIDTSKKVELVWYVLGDGHADSPKIQDQINAMLEKDINATIKLNFTTWNDWQTKYNLLLTSGEKVDMVFASTWADYYKFADQGAFKELNDLLPTYMPETWKAVPKQDWDEATVNGKIYAVPSTYPEYTPDGLVYREDWRKELNVPEIKDLDSIEAYLDAVKTQKKVTPINGKAWNEVFTLFKAYHGYEQIGGDSGVIVAKSYDAPRDIVNYAETPEFEQFVKRMKTWSQKGFWTSDTLSSQKEAGDALKAGTGGAYWRNAPGAGGFIVDAEKTNKGTDYAYFPFTRFHGYAMPTLSVNNAMAVPKSSKNAERSLMALEKIRTDSRYFDLLTYGIQDTHYSLSDDGKLAISPPKGKENDKNFKGYGITSWGWRVTSLAKEQQAGGWTEFPALMEEFKAESKPNIFAPIIMDYKPVKSQQAAVNQVIQQYGMPLMMGLVPDVDKALETYRKQLKAAGVDQVLAYVQEQANAYFDEKGIQ